MKNMRRAAATVGAGVAMATGGVAFAEVYTDPTGTVSVGTAEGDYAQGAVAVSPFGSAWGDLVGVSTGWTFGGLVAVGGGDDYHWGGLLNVGLGGEHTVDAYATSPSIGPTGPYVGVGFTATGDNYPCAHGGGYGAAVSITGCSSVYRTGPSVSVAGPEAYAYPYGEKGTVAVAGRGDAYGAWVSVAGSGDADAKGGLTAVSVFGNATGGCFNVSVFGKADPGGGIPCATSPAP